MKENGSIELFQYWNRLRDGRPAPKRTEIEPADIKTLLADTFILEKDLRGEAVFRLAGTRLCASYGRELKGFSFPSLWRDKDRRLIARLVYSVFRSKSVVVVDYEGRNAGGQGVPFELLLLPLEGGLENPRCLGVASPVERIFWLGSDPIVDAVIDSVRVVDPEREPFFLGNRPAVPFPADTQTEPAVVNGNPIPGTRRIRHLTVIEGGRLQQT